MPENYKRTNNVIETAEELIIAAFFMAFCARDIVCLGLEEEYGLARLNGLASNPFIWSFDEFVLEAEQPSVYLDAGMNLINENFVSQTLDIDEVLESIPEEINWDSLQPHFERARRITLQMLDLSEEEVALLNAIQSLGITESLEKLCSS